MLITKKTFVAILFLHIFLFTFATIVSAHPGNTASDGCHYCRTNCDRWGVPWNVRHCHGGTSLIEQLPRCESQLGDSGEWTFTQNGCNQDITITWDKGVNDEAYSIGISKTPGADPGPKADTTYRTWTFKDVKPGTWYINAKAGATNCVTSDIRYWKVEVPAVKPSLDVREEVISEKERRLLIDSECATSVSSDKPLKNLRPGFASTTIYPTKDTTYTIYAKSGKEITFRTVEVKYPLPTPTPYPSPLVKPTNPPQERRSLWSWLFD